MTELHGTGVRIDGLTKTYETREDDDVLALDRIDLAIEAGSFVAVVGPSGCGKSTLLSLVAGLQPATSGFVSIDGDVVRRPHPKIGMVFQADLLLTGARSATTSCCPSRSSTASARLTSTGRRRC